MTQYTFTAFENADLFGTGAIASHASFTLPAGATLAVTVTDDDARLSGDARRNERGDDTSQQTATILRDGTEIGNLGRLYAERVWHVTDEDGTEYRLVELEQPGTLPDSFTFLGDVPAAGSVLTVGGASNVSGHGLRFDDLGAGNPPAPNIVDIAAGSDDFNILVKALSAAGLVDAVRGLDDITVFAPTDAAFTQLALDLGFAGDAGNEDAVFGFIAEALAGLDPNGDPIPLLTDVLLYHVSPGAKTAADVDTATAVATLLEGATFGSEGTELIDNEPDIDNPNIVIPDIGASNGTIQAIDRVLIPLDIPGNSEEQEPPATELPTLTAIVAASGGTFDADGTDFDLLLNAVQTAGLAGALDDPNADLTVFAPNDAAFVGLAQALGFNGTDEGSAFSYLVEALTLLGGGDPIPLLTEVLTYHVAPGSLDSTAVLGADSIATLQGGNLGVDGATLVDADPDVPNPNLIATDIEAANGIAHVIDGVLLPVDVLAGDGSNDVDFIIANNASNVIFTGRDTDFVDGNGGRDIVFLGKGDDVALGGDGNDILFGNRGADRLEGGAGNDRLIGGHGKDTFVFRTGDGKDAIRGFQDGQDTIDLSGTAFTSFEELEIGIHSRSYGAVIDLGEDQMIYIQGRNVDLTEDDFLF
jgi:uncharacterized surface protein with fasciclin (FAS1) repeats